MAIGDVIDEGDAADDRPDGPDGPDGTDAADVADAGAGTDAAGAWRGTAITSTTSSVATAANHDPPSSTREFGPRMMRSTRRLSGPPFAAADSARLARDSSSMRSIVPYRTRSAPETRMARSSQQFSRSSRTRADVHHAAG